MNSEELLVTIIEKMNTEGIEKTMEWVAEQLDMDKSSYEKLFQLYAQNPTMSDQDLFLLKNLLEGK
ncbi:hypothetical protein SAMN05880501_101172 [Ureibacillus xyleni]|uniref:Uncharacterized protein n=1 Tax=Ureibacillus xyleni TaxID=614648 RepID=A0A285R8S1_9BACL|nr:hypothetical protein [Ureibacillus xyleni]SOB90506.1 hypothetical protein SAMN05880501_101172 [Ureibacillus xyleni]